MFHACTIIPKSEEKKFLKIASENGLHVHRKCDVQGRPDAKVKRVLLELGKETNNSVESRLVLELDRHIYSEEFKKLTSAFYLDRS